MWTIPEVGLCMDVRLRTPDAAVSRGSPIFLNMLSTEKRRHRMVAEQSQNDLISMSCVGELLLIGAPLKANANTTSLPAVSVLVITTVGRPATPRGHRRSLTWGNGTET